MVTMMSEDIPVDIQAVEGQDTMMQEVLRTLQIQKDKGMTLNKDIQMVITTSAT